MLRGSQEGEGNRGRELPSAGRMNCAEQFHASFQGFLQGPGTPTRPRPSLTGPWEGLLITVLTISDLGKGHHLLQPSSLGFLWRLVGLEEGRQEEPTGAEHTHDHEHPQEEPVNHHGHVFPVFDHLQVESEAYRGPSRAPSSRIHTLPRGIIGLSQLGGVKSQWGRGTLVRIFCDALSAEPQDVGTTGKLGSSPSHLGDSETKINHK